MKPKHASRTAEGVAAIRAIESARPQRDRLFVDPLAAAFLGPKMRAVLTLSRLPGMSDRVMAFYERALPGVLGSTLCRVRYIDEAAPRAVAAGCRQVVLLGAGYDSRAYRLAELGATRVLELDHPATQERKRARLRAALGELPPHVEFAPVDFAAEPLASALARGGYRVDEPAFFIWEGVCEYLAPEEVEATLACVAGAAPGSQIVFTFVDKTLIDAPARLAGGPQFRRYTERGGEPMRFGIVPGELRAFLAARGFELVDCADMERYSELYPAVVRRGLRPAPFIFVALARVAAAA